MKLNNKGVSLTEIIISVTLVSLIIVYLLSMLISLRHESNTSKKISTLQTNQALLSNQIHNDFIERELIGVYTCEDSGTTNRKNDTIQQIIHSTSHNFNQQEGTNCLKFKYKIGERGSQYGYLVYYNYTHRKDSSGRDEKVDIVGYRRGIDEEDVGNANVIVDSKAVFRQTPSKPTSYGEATVKCGSGVCTVHIKLPILAENGDDYGINLSYVSTDPANFEVERKLSSWYRFEIK